MHVHLLVVQVRKVGPFLLKTLAHYPWQILTEYAVDHPKVLLLEVATQLDQHEFLAVEGVAQLHESVLFR